MAEVKTTQESSLARSFFQSELRGLVELREVLPGNIPGYSITSQNSSILVPSANFDLKGSRYNKLEAMQLVALEYGCLLSEIGSGPMSSIRIDSDEAISDPEIRNHMLVSAIKDLLVQFGHETEFQKTHAANHISTTPYLRPLDFITFLRPDSGLAMNELTVINESTAYEHNYDTTGFAGVRISTKVRPGDACIVGLVSQAKEHGYTLELIDNRARLHEMRSRNMGIAVVQDRDRHQLLDGFDRLHDTGDLYHFHLGAAFSQDDRNQKLWDFVNFVNAKWPELRG